MAQLLCALEDGTEPEISGRDNLETMKVAPNLVGVDNSEGLDNKDPVLIGRSRKSLLSDTRVTLASAARSSARCGARR